MSKEKPIPEMCKGCARNKKMYCEIIKRPEYIYKRRKICFSWVDAKRAAEIEEEIRANTGAV